MFFDNCIQRTFRHSLLVPFILSNGAYQMLQIANLKIIFTGSFETFSKQVSAGLDHHLSKLFFFSRSLSVRVDLISIAY